MIDLKIKKTEKPKASLAAEVMKQIEKDEAVDRMNLEMVSSLRPAFEVVCSGAISESKKAQFEELMTDSLRFHWGPDAHVVLDYASQEIICKHQDGRVVRI